MKIRKKYLKTDMYIDDIFENSFLSYSWTYMMLHFKYWRLLRKGYVDKNKVLIARNRIKLKTKEISLKEACDIANSYISLENHEYAVLDGKVVLIEKENVAAD